MGGLIYLLYLGLLALLRLPVLGEEGECLRPDQLCHPVCGWDPTLAAAWSPLLCMDESCKCRKPPCQARLVLHCGGFSLHLCTAAFWMLEQGAEEGSSFPRLSCLCRGFVNGDPRGWAVLHAVEPGLLPSSSIRASMDSVGSWWCPGQNQAVLCQA